MQVKCLVHLCKYSLVCWIHPKVTRYVTIIWIDFSSADMVTNLLFVVQPFLCSLPDPTHLRLIPYTKQSLLLVQAYHFPIYETTKGDEFNKQRISKAFSPKGGGLITPLPIGKAVTFRISHWEHLQLHTKCIFVVPKTSLTDFKDTLEYMLCDHIALWTAFVWHLSKKQTNGQCLNHECKREMLEEKWNNGDFYFH